MRQRNKKINLTMPVSDRGYLRRKNREISFLKTYAGRGGHNLKGAATHLDILRAKLNLKKDIRAAQLKKLDSYFSESNLFGFKGPLSIGTFEFSYGYQRAGIDVLKNHVSKTVYSFLKKSRSESLYEAYLSSCQSGISTFFFTLAHLGSKPKIVAVADAAYWETAHFLERQNYDFCPAVRPRAKTPEDYLLLIDSSVLRENFLELVAPLIKRASIVVLDSTCFEIGSADTRAICRICDSAARPYVIFRSHNKLDSMATEYSRLGSVVFMFPKNGSRLERQRVVRIYKNFKFYCRLFGAYPDFSALHPFLDNPRFHEINSRRIASQRDANRSVGSDLENAIAPNIKNEISIERYAHELFFTVNIKTPRSDQWIDSVVRRLEIHFLARGVPHLISASFGWDFTAVTVINGRLEVEDAEPKTMFRFSIGDYGPGLQKKTSEALRSWIKDLSKVL